MHRTKPAVTSAFEFYRNFGIDKSSFEYLLNHVWRIPDNYSDMFDRLFLAKFNVEILYRSIKDGRMLTKHTANPANVIWSKHMTPDKLAKVARETPGINLWVSYRIPAAKTGYEPVMMIGGFVNKENN